MLLAGAGGDSRSKAIPWPQSAGATGTASHPAHGAELTQPPWSPGPVLVCGPSVPLLCVLWPLWGGSGEAALSCSGVIGLFVSLLFNGVICSPAPVGWGYLD